MENLASFYPLMLFITFSLSLFYGLYILNLNPKGKSNRHFFIMTLALCIWSLSLAMSIVSASQESALLLKRLSASGKIMIHAFLLHMIIIYTSYDDKLGKGRMFLLYIPSFVYIYIFSLSSIMSPLQYRLIKMDFGWTSRPIYNVFYISYCIYSLTYIIINFLLINKWKEKDIKNKNQANILSRTLITFALAVFSNLVVDLTYNSKALDPSPILSFVPLLIINHLFKQSELVKKNNDSDWDKIFNEESRKKLFIILSSLFFGGGSLNFVQYFLPQLLASENEMSNIVISSIVFYITGIMLMLIQLIKNEKLRDVLGLFFVLLSIPITALAYLQTSSVTIWIIPIILIIIFILMDSKIPITAITIVGVITQFLVWKYAPSGPVLMDSIDFLLRAGIIIFAYLIAIVINKLYIKRLKDNIHKTKLQKIISDISFNFINIDKESFEENLNTILKTINDFLKTDKSFIFVFNNKVDKVDGFYECGIENPNTKNSYNNINISFKDLPCLMHELRNKKIISIPNSRTLPFEIIRELDSINKRDFKSLFAIPIEKGDEIIGFIGCKTVYNHKELKDNDIEFLKILSNILGSILIKIKSEEKIEHLAYYDRLTGLPNRVLFTDKLTKAIHSARKNKTYIPVILIDLDSFKIVNDTMGHSQGDYLLQKTANRLGQCFGKENTVARFGGDEFLIFINNLESYKAIIKEANKLMELFKHPFNIKGQDFYITVSAGLAIYPFDGEDPETLIKNADIAMYASKENRKNQYTICTAKIKDEIERNIRLSNDLFNLENKNELILHYQPQIDIKTEKIVGLEALLRWNHPELGLIPPNIFIPLAELNGTINNIGEWVFKTALTQSKNWHKKGFSNLRIAVNLSVVQFNNPDFSKNLDKILERVGFDPKFLELEITESVAGQKAKNVIRTLDKFKDIGVTISIDDFGTDYSSLNRLKMLPIDRIKIDMLFIQSIEKSEKDRTITRIIINLAKSLNIAVLAEGVETKEQLDFLKQNKCDEVQGYYYYKPMLARDIENILK